jgi:hypothetical protein
VMIGTAASFHALPSAHGAQGSSWLLRSSTQVSEPDSHPLAAVTVTTLTEADGRPYCDRSTGYNHHVDHAWPRSRTSERCVANFHVWRIAGEQRLSGKGIRRLLVSLRTWDQEQEGDEEPCLKMCDTTNGTARWTCLPAVAVPYRGPPENRADQIPPDLVVKPQRIDIIDVNLWLI